MSGNADRDPPMTEEERLRIFGSQARGPMKTEDQIPSFLKVTPSLRALVLDQAREAVTKDRAATHGAVESSFGQLAAVWSVRLGVTVTPAQVALMLVDLKVTRAWGNPVHADNWVDIAGYAACGGELAGGAP